MRIIGGSLKGRIINPVDLNIRPTTDFAKEALFNILSNNYPFETLHVLDLFGGSGSISFEFASRGAPHITCVEMKAHNALFIKKTAIQLKLNSIQVIQQNVFDFITHCTQKYHLIFADPPFQLPLLASLPERMETSRLLHPNGIFILEHSGSFDFKSVHGFRSVRKYGNVHFSFFCFDAQPK